MKHLNLTILALLISLASFGQLPITGASTICVGMSTTLSDATPGGTWSSSDITVLTINPTTGVAIGIAAGVATVSYTVGTYVTYTVTVEPVPSPISCPTTMCPGDSYTPVMSPPGGTWSSSTPGVITVGLLTGTISAVAAGGATITYTTPAGCYVTLPITVNTTPAPITGSGSVCLGTTITLTDPGGGTWTSSAPGVATVTTTTGIVTGIALGTTTISYTIGAGCPATRSVTVTAAPTAHVVTGGGAYCAGGTGLYVGLAGSTYGVSYSLLNGGTVVSTVSGTGTSISFGAMTAAGTYTVVANYGTTCATTMTGSATVVINPLPTAYTIMGGGPYCSGGSGDDLTLSGSDAGINYQLYNGTTMVGAAIAGTGTTIDFGWVTLAGTYTILATNTTTGCNNTMSGTAVVSITSLVVPTVTISASPGTTVCPGTTVNYTPTPTGGGSLPTYSWSVNGVIVGSGSTYSYIPTTGDVVGVVMTSSALCASPTTASATVIMTVAVPPTITATATPASCGGAVTLTSSGGVSYSWSPTTGLPCPGCASNTFIPASTTTYSVIGTDGTGCTGTATVTVDGNSISGYISYTGTPAAGDFTIWLVQFNPSDSSITATDSMLNCVNVGMPYYEFMDKPAGNYMVKAKLNGSVPGTSGYIPTYSLSSPTWDTAATLSHSVFADTMHINMIYGTVPPGPGFISGFVYSGAGKNTSSSVPVANMTIYLKNAAGHVVTYVVTGTDGSYSFHGIAEGSYSIYPESYKYYTTPSATITLAPGNDTARAINFKQHTTFGTITPYDFTKVPQPSVNATGISIYPNPTSGNLNIQWSNQAIGKSTITITDMTGREVYTSSLDINKPSGQFNFDLNEVVDGIYMVTIKSDKIFYSGRLIKRTN